MVHTSKVDNRFGGRAPAPTRDLADFHYDAPAELFLGPRMSVKSRPKYLPTYQRFDTAAEALRFVIEGMPAALLPRAWLVVEEVRFRADQIRHLYEDADYPLPRAAHKC
ncbi:MAG TPA: hypothetical protein VGG01_13215 [Xanthobacteraceae bacterium]|jgi:hypothetical protein